jgi:hypothetical protein
MAVAKTYHSTHFKLPEGCDRYFGHVTQSEVGQVHEVYIPQTAIFGQSHVTHHEDNFEDIQQVVICGIGVEISNDHNTETLLR